MSLSPLPPPLKCELADELGANFSETEKTTSGLRRLRAFSSSLAHASAFNAMAPAQVRLSHFFSQSACASVSRVSYARILLALWQILSNANAADVS